MKNILSIVSVLFSCLLCTILAPRVFANHRSGDDPLPELIRMADFDGDGIPDLAVNMSGFDHIAILKGDGHANFILKRQFETDTLPKGIVLGDFNKDRKLDLVTVQDWGYNIKVNLGDGLGGFTFAQELNGDGEPTRIYTADVNNDGKLDLIANAPAEGNVLIYLGKGKSGFETAASEIEDHKNCQALGVGDFNGDGNQDLAIAYFTGDNENLSHIAILLGDGHGNFTPLTEFQPSPEVANVAVVDLNGDGKLDLIATGGGSENDQFIYVDVFLGDGTGNFTTKQITNLGTGSIKGEPAIADFNEDGKLDVAVPISSFGDRRGDLSTMLDIFLGDGTGTLTQSQTVTVGQSPHSALPYDFDGDGHIDVVVSNRSDGTMTVLLGDGHGNFTTHATITLNALPQ